MKAINLGFACLLMIPVTCFAENSSTEHRSTTDSAGTTVTTDTVISNTTGWTGNQKNVIDQRTTVDPEGLANKKTASRKIVRNNMGNGDFSEKTEIEHADGTSETVVDKKSTSQHWLDKGHTTTKTHTRVVDPKGLGNEMKIVEKEVVDVSPDGTRSKSLTVQKDGDVVSKTETTTKN